MFTLLKNLNYERLLLVFVIFLLPFSVFAANLEVAFEKKPLFSESDFLPGDAVVRTVTVINHSTTTQNIITEAINVEDAGGLGAELDLTIKKGTVELFNDTLSEFLRHGAVALSPLAEEASTTYTFFVAFNEDAGNGLQGASLGFDLCVGFEGGNRNCGNTAIGSEQDTNNGNPPIGGGGSGGTVPGTDSGGGGFVADPQPPGSLAITGIQAYAPIDLGPGVVRIVWDTNYLSTSQVVYGLASLGPYSIDINDPNFGYPFATVKDINKVDHHVVDITGLAAGETYLYRVVSTASPPTVSFERSFTVPVGKHTGEVLASASGGPIRLEVQKTETGNQSTSHRRAAAVIQNGTVQVIHDGSVEDLPSTIVSGAQNELKVPPVEAESDTNDPVAGTNSLAASIFNTVFEGNIWMFLFGGIGVLFLVFVVSRRKTEYV